MASLSSWGGIGVTIRSNFWVLELKAVMGQLMLTNELKFGNLGLSAPKAQFATHLSQN